MLSYIKLLHPFFLSVSEGRKPLIVFINCPVGLLDFMQPEIHVSKKACQVVSVARLESPKLISKQSCAFYGVNHERLSEFSDRTI